MTYNKAQKACMSKWSGTFFLGGFLEEFNAIDPKPDVKTYKVMFKDNIHYKKWVENEENKAFTKEEAVAELRKYLLDYVDNVVFYNGVYLKIKLDIDLVHEFMIDSLLPEDL